MTLQIRDSALNPEAGTTESPVRFDDWINYKGLTPDECQKVMQHAQAAPTRASHHLGGGVIIRAFAKAVIAAVGKWWRAYNTRRAHIAAARELHALDDRTLRDIGVNHSEIEWLVVYGRDASPRVSLKV
jgi:uncharacterized protein YjiS (DUF1127 family)